MTPIQKICDCVLDINTTLEFTPPNGLDGTYPSLKKVDTSSCHISVDDWEGGYKGKFTISCEVTCTTLFTVQNLIAVEQHLNAWLDNLGIEGIGSEPMLINTWDESDKNTLNISWNLYILGGDSNE